MTDDTLGPEAEERLRAGAAELGVALDDRQVAQLLAYLRCVLAWNGKINVTAVRGPLAGVERHLLDSLSLVPIWAALFGPGAPAHVLDLGTGGGFPGAPLAVAWPSAQVLQIDGTGKKVRVVADCLAAAGIDNAEALQCRGHELPHVRPEVEHGFELCVARAVGAAAPLLVELARLVAPGGHIVLMKGPQPPDDELAAARETARGLRLTELPPQPTGVPGGERGLALIWRRDARPVSRPSGRRAGRRPAASGRRGRGSGGSSRGRRR